MAKKILTASLEDFEGQEIYLNVTFLEKGIYELKILDKDVIVKNTYFIKK